MNYLLPLKSDLHISTSDTNGGNCSNLTLFNIEMQRNLPHYWSDTGIQ